MNKYPRVGIAVIIKKNGEVLLGKRKNSHGEDTWGFPGGHLEYKEDIYECALREVEEEVGLETMNLNQVALTNDIFEKEDKHYITIYIECEYYSGNIILKEPDKCSEWRWFTWNQLKHRTDLFLPIKNLIRTHYKPNFNE